MSNKAQKSLFEVFVRPAGDGAVEIVWTGGRPGLIVTIFGGPSPDRIDTASPLAEIKEADLARIEGLALEKRTYFLVSPQGGPGVIAAARGLSLAGTFNFRDLGGYRTLNDRRIKWGRVFRSDSLARLTEAGQTFLRNLELKLVLDLRSSTEVQKSPDLLPPGGPRYVNLPVQTSELNFVTAMERFKKGDLSWLTPDFMIRGYLRNVEECPGVWAEALRLAAEPQNQPLVFHCTGGKDRAGTLAALLLLVLGVPEETVVQDHQLTNELIGDLLAKVDKYLLSLGIDPELARPYFTAPRDCITALLGHLQAKYGTVENYLTDKAGLDPETLTKLKDELLES
ncbi:MAG: tyrosine-protein phosphatase [Thermodesulfobacteriota bacterium]